MFDWALCEKPRGKLPGRKKKKKILHLLLLQEPCAAGAVGCRVLRAAGGAGTRSASRLPNIYTAPGSEVTAASVFKFFSFFTSVWVLPADSFTLASRRCGNVPELFALTTAEVTGE